MPKCTARLLICNFWLNCKAAPGYDLMMPICLSVCQTFYGLTPDIGQMLRQVCVWWAVCQSESPVCKKGGIRTTWRQLNTWFHFVFLTDLQAINSKRGISRQDQLNKAISIDLDPRPLQSCHINLKVVSLFLQANSKHLKTKIVNFPQCTHTLNK